MSDFVAKFKRIGITVDSAEKFNETVEITLTVGQLSKMADVCPSEIMGLAENKRIAARVAIADLEHAIATNARPARRAGGVKVDIASETVYTISTGENAINDVTEARWDSSAKDGNIYINGMDYRVNVGRAEDYFDIGEESDPDRPVYYIVFIAEPNTEDEDAEESIIVSYGITNLIRSIASYKNTIAPKQ